MAAVQVLDERVSPDHDTRHPVGLQTPHRPEPSFRACKVLSYRRPPSSARAAPCEVAKELGCDWHTVNDAVLAYGQALLEDPGRFGVVSALGLDEVAFLRGAPYYRTQFSTSIVDVGRAQFLDVVPSRSGKEPTAWLQTQGHEWLAHVRYATLDLSGPYRAVFNTVLPGAILGGRSLSCGEVGQRQTRRVSTVRPERTTRTTGGEKTTRSTGCGVYSPRPKNNSAITEETNCSVCCELVTQRVTL